MHSPTSTAATPPAPPATNDLTDSAVDDRWTSSAAGVSLYSPARRVSIHPACRTSNAPWSTARDRDSV